MVVAFHFVDERQAARVEDFGLCAEATQQPHSLFDQQTRVRTLNGELSAIFKRWYPDMDLEVEEMPVAA